MIEPGVHIQGGYNNFDPLLDYFTTAAAGMEQNPAVVASCPTALREVLGLVARFADQSGLVCDATFTSLRTPPVTYVGRMGQEGLVRLRAECVLDRGQAAALLTDFGCYLDIMAPDGYAVDWTPYKLVHNGLLVNGVSGLRAGTLVELNYLRNNVVEKVRAAAFPVDEARKAERDADRAADAHKPFQVQLVRPTS